MPAEIATALIAASGAVVLAGASYWFTKQRERDAELRKEKLEHYKDFVASLSGTIAWEDTPEGHRAYTRACNNLNLIAPIPVLQALQAFRDETRISNPSPCRERHDQLLSKLFLEIRKDLGVIPRDSVETFKICLWASGHPTNGP
ncbi:MAG TPA: hypothetical protein PKC65_02865 [Pyrinomonadaceae bacterium]|nr:hypothetical protein [Pyrinomonadaceae bacterium]